jgi:hypothetical protein
MSRTCVQCASPATPRRGNTGRYPKYCAAHRQQVTRVNKARSKNRVVTLPCDGTASCSCDQHEGYRQVDLKYRELEHRQKIDRREGGHLAAMLSDGFHIEPVRYRGPSGWDSIHLLAEIGSILGLLFWFQLKYRPRKPFVFDYDEGLHIVFEGTREFRSLADRWR